MAYGLVDTGSDICIMGKDLARRVIAARKLRKSQCRRPDRVAHTYDGHSFTLHGRVDIDITFGDTVMNTPVYIKLDAKDQLLLSEEVCHQFGLLTYHTMCCSDRPMTKKRKKEKNSQRKRKSIKKAFCGD